MEPEPEHILSPAITVTPNNNMKKTKTEAALLSLKNLVEDASTSPVNNMKPIDVNVSIRANEPQFLEISPIEIEKHIKNQEIARLKQYANQYVEKKTFNKKFNLALENNPILYEGICSAASREFLETTKRFLQENKFAFCMNPRGFYSNILKLAIDKLKKKQHLDGGLPSLIIDLIVKNENLISLLITLLTLPVLPFCITGAPQAVFILFETLSVIIDIIMGELCSMNVIKYNLVIRKALTKLSNKFKSLYSAKAIQDVKEKAKESFAKFKKMRDKLKIALSESGLARAVSEGTQKIRNKVKGSYNYVKGRLTKKNNTENRFANIIKEFPPELPSASPIAANSLLEAKKESVGGKSRRNRKHRR